MLNEFDRVIGLDRLKAVHFNDSMNDCGSHKDRHAKIGEGKIGAEAMRRVALHPLLEGRPFILETPNDDEGTDGRYRWSGSGRGKIAANLNRK